ncbi:MAG TPA: hypothetical protein VGM37_01080 [Armatimonadota bacterium]|jgi:hypothetical protein
MARSNKKIQAIELYDEGITDVEAIAARLRTSASYVANTLAAAGRTVGYHDLYTSTGLDRSRYARLFNGALRFKDTEAARASVDRLNALYEAFRSDRDRRGMFHAEFIALMGAHRAHGCGKHNEAEVFAAWLRDKLSREDDMPPRPAYLDIWEQEQPPLEYAAA